MNNLYVGLFFFILVWKISRKGIIFQKSLKKLEKIGEDVWKWDGFNKKDHVQIFRQIYLSLSKCLTLMTF